MTDTEMVVFRICELAASLITVTIEIVTGLLSDTP
jgi:hypothetical protein